jgi:hypothetical protein
MKDETVTLTGWPAVPVFLMAVVTQGLTALVMAVPITWLANHIFSVKSIHWAFSDDRLGYWKCVGLFAIWFAAKGRIKWKLKS